MLRICKELFFRTQKLNYLNGKLTNLIKSTDYINLNEGGGVIIILPNVRTVIGIAAMNGTWLAYNTLTIIYTNNELNLILGEPFANSNVKIFYI